MPPNDQNGPDNPYPNSGPPPGPSTHRGVPIGSLYPNEHGSPSVTPPPTEQPVPEISGPPPEEEPPKNWRQNLRSYGPTVLLLLLAPIIAWSISAFALQSYQVDGSSMEHTLQTEDRLIIDKVPRTWSRLTHHAYVPKRGDIIIFNLPAYVCNSTQPEQLIKRVIGLPGERVVVKGHDTTVYNQEHPKGFNPDKAGKYTPIDYDNPQPADITLESEQLFVMGDNRPDSCDSRFFGAVKLKDIVGKLSLRIMPFNKWSKF